MYVANLDIGLLLMDMYLDSSLGVAANGFKKLFDTLVALFIAKRRARYMLSGVILNNFVHQSVDSSTCGSYEMQCFRAIGIRFQCTLNGLDLPRDAFHALEKIVFV